MKKHRNPVIFVITFLMIASLACSLGAKQSPKLGETLRSDAGGFSLQTVTGYEVKDVFGMVIMMPTDADEETGPFIMAFGSLVDGKAIAQEIWAELKDEATGDMNFSKPKKIKVDGVEGLLIEFSGKEKGQELKGKVFVAAPYANQSFQITALAPKARWKEIERNFDAVLKSVRFFEAEPFDFGLDDFDWGEDFDSDDFDWDVEDWSELWDDENLDELFDKIIDELDLDGIFDGFRNQGGGE